MPLLYSEMQVFRQWWLWVIILVSTTILLYVIIGQINEGNLSLVIVFCILGVGFPLFMYKLQLKTEVTEKGIHIRFFPFHWKWIFFKFDDIELTYAITYNPLMDYGGWGIRYGFKDRGKAYNVSGNQGVLIKFKRGKDVLIGSSNHDKLSQIINERVSALNEKIKANS